MCPSSSRECPVARYSYQVCQQQANRITFVDGQWIGTVPLGSADNDALYAACPEVWDYLSAAGKGGWELVATVPAGSPEYPYQLLYLRHTD